MKKDIYQIDTFTTNPYCGNPAGVVPDATELNEIEMLNIAREMNLSETAFVFSGGEGYDFEVRFFTPVEEIDLCGHATVATFSLFKSLNLLDSERTEFIQKAKAGHLEVKFLDDGTVLMKQAEPVKLQKDFPILELCNAMGLKHEDIGIENIMYSPEI